MQQTHARTMNQTVSKTIATLTINAFECDGELTIRIRADPGEEHGFAGAQTLKRQGIIDDLRPLLDIEAFEAQESRKVPPIETVAKLQIDAETGEHVTEIRLNGALLADDADLSRLNFDYEVIR